MPSDPAAERTIVPRLPRRGLIARGLGGWLLGRVPFLAASLSGSAMVTALCSEWRCPGTIAVACLDVLPAGEASKDALTRIVLGELQTAGSSVRTLARAIRARSRDDFRDGRIAIVDGWMLSWTETRVYALTALLGEAAA